MCPGGYGPYTFSSFLLCFVILDVYSLYRKICIVWFGTFEVPSINIQFNWCHLVKVVEYQIKSAYFN